MNNVEDNPQTIDIQYRFFTVAEREFCVWEYDLTKLNQNFLESIDPKYFEFVANIYARVLLDRDEAKLLTLLDRITDYLGKKLGREYFNEHDSSRYASLGVRFAYSLGLETLFAFIAAFMQSPMCPFAWIRLYKPWELDSVISNIHEQRSFHSLVNLDQISWESVSQAIHTNLVMESSEREEEVKEGFARLWRKFASDFLDPMFKEEFNSIKHGLRIRPGGFYMAIGTETEPGVRAPKENMQLLGKSDFGSSFLSYEKLGDLSRHVRFIRKHRNWNPEDMIWGLNLISISIGNIISTMKILNGTSAEEVKFSWPRDPETLQEPWLRTRRLGVTSMSGFQRSIPVEIIEPYSIEEMRSRISEGKEAGIRRIRFTAEDN